VLLGSKGHSLGLELVTGALSPSGFACQLSLSAASSCWFAGLTGVLGLGNESSWLKLIQ